MAKRYLAKVKFHVVKELLSGDKTAAQVAKARGIYPNTARSWKKTFLEKGRDVFTQDSVLAQYDRKTSCFLVTTLRRITARNWVGLRVGRQGQGKPPCDLQDLAMRS